MKFKITLLIMVFACLTVTAQQIEPATQNFAVEITPEHIPSIASRGNDIVPVVDKEGIVQDGRASRIKTVIGKDDQTQDDYFVRNRSRSEQTIQLREPSLVFDAYSSSSSPTDPSMAVGPDHVIVTFNTGFTIYDKEGNVMAGPMAPNPTIFPNGGCCDLTVSYDNEADRWVLTFLGGGAQVAVSDGPDPINDGWFNYNIPQINDYQKLSIWSDGYYVTDNTSGPNKLYALERDAMLAGDTAAIIGLPLPGIATSGFASAQAFHVTNGDLPAPGNATVVYLQDDAFPGVSEDHLKVWNVNVDFGAGTGTVDTPVELPTTEFIGVFDGGSFANLSQPGGGADIDALQATIMNQAQFRKFSDHNSAVFSFVVDTDASGGELAGIRWYELRQDGDGEPWSIFQEGTYISPNGKHAWNGAMSMDIQGNIAMGYTAMAGPTTTDPTSERVSSNYTGRFAADPLNTMTVVEERIGTSNQNVPNFRYCDYSKLDIDPENDKTFWHINEYVNSGRKGIVGVFQIAPNFTNDVGVVSIDEPLDGILSGSENVTVSIFNFGEESQAAIPVELIVDGTTVATEVFAGPLASATTAQYTFTTPVDFGTAGQTYTVTAQTNLATDEDNDNDAATRDVTNIFANDIGVTDITSPGSEEGLGSEEITVTIENFGAVDQSNFDVSYTVNGGASVTETVAGPLVAGTTTSYTFGTLADLSTPDQAYVIVARTSLSGDSNAGNDSFERTVVNLTCDAATNDTDMPIGPNQGDVTESVITITDDFIVTQPQVTINLNHTFMGDLSIELEGPDGTVVSLSNQNGGSGDNMLDTTFTDNAGQTIAGGTPPYGGTYTPEEVLSNFDGISSLGDWTLRITDNANQDGGNLLDWSLTLCDNLGLGLEDELATDAELIILDKGNDQFEIQLPTTQLTDKLELRITNMTGQTLMGYRLENQGNGYYYDLDMSYAASGVYIVTLATTTGTAGQSKRLIVR